MVTKNDIEKPKDAQYPAGIELLKFIATNTQYLKCENRKGTGK